MKKFLTLVTLFVTVILRAQVGIGTTNPQQALDVAGTDPTTETIRIQSLNSANNPLNDGVTLASLAVDSDGDIVINNPMTVVQNIPSNAFINPPVAVTSNDGNFTRGLIYTSNALVLTKPTLVEINVTVSVGLAMPNGDAIIDGTSRKYGIELLINGVDAARAADSYTNGEAEATGSPSNPNVVTYNSGYFTLPINYKTVLVAGNYTFTLNGQVVGANNSTTSGVMAEFGDILNYSNFQIITYN